MSDSPRLTRFRIGIMHQGDEWRIWSQDGDRECIIYDPPHPTREEAIKAAKQVDADFRQSLIDEGTEYWKAV